VSGTDLLVLVAVLLLELVASLIVVAEVRGRRARATGGSDDWTAAWRNARR
jgi:hypothetical protein